jgi:hypothetical protein
MGGGLLPQVVVALVRQGAGEVVVGEHVLIVRS